MPALFKHQQHTRDAILDLRNVMVLSDPGTGKTAAVLAAIERWRKQLQRGRALVLAPKSILEAAWCDDCRRFTPQLSIAAAYAQNRARAFAMGTDVVVTNHDATTWLAKNPAVLDGFDFLAVDESTAYKNKDSQRSRALAKLAERFEVRVMMTGTPMPNGLIDIWHQAYLCDLGERLGTRFYAFRAVTHEPHTVAYNIQEWREKPGARETVADLLADITVRYALRDCVDVPKNFVPPPRRVRLNKALRTQYDTMVREALLQLDTGEIEALNAISLRTKLLQIASGAVYGNDGQYHLLDTARYELVAQLISERDHSICAFLWRHQRDGILAQLQAQGITNVAVIDGTTRDRDRPQIVRDFQAGKYRALLAHPASAGHGLTLTRAATAIWPSPTDNAEHYHQFNARIDRNGQTRETEILRVEAEDTVEAAVYAALESKLSGQVSLLELLQTLTLPSTTP